MSSGQSLTSPRELRLLVVDDCRDTAHSLAILLQHRGFTVRLAHDGAEALAVAKSFLPHCIMSDIEMPGVDGYRLAELVRQDRALQGVILIAISGNYDRNAVRAVGFDFDFAKPADPIVLEALLHRMLIVEKQQERTEQLIQKQGEVSVEATEVLKEVKSDVKEMKAELKEVKQDLKEIKDEIRNPDDKDA